MQQALEHELAGTSLGVAVLCPAAVSTDLFLSTRLRPARFGGPIEPPRTNPNHDELQDCGLHPDAVGRRLVAALRAGEFFVFTDSAPRLWLDERHARIGAAFDALDRYNADLGQRG